MPVTRDHHLVGRQVVYRAHHPGAKPEQGMVTSVNVEAGLVFVNYGRGSTSQATSALDLEAINGEPVSYLLERGSGRTLRQLQAAPDEFWFVVGRMGERHHVEYLMEKHGIEKTVRFVEVGDVLSRCRGTGMPIVVDHAAVEKLDEWTQYFLVEHMSRYNPSAPPFTGA